MLAGRLTMFSWQSWEKTMDCHSPGQGLMPASFKVRTILLDGDDAATEDVLDPDFGEAAIGRVAPVDSGRQLLLPYDSYFLADTLILSSSFFSNINFPSVVLTFYYSNVRTLVDYTAASIWKMHWRFICARES